MLYGGRASARYLGWAPADIVEHWKGQTQAEGAAAARSGIIITLPFSGLRTLALRSELLGGKSIVFRFYTCVLVAFISLFV